MERESTSMWELSFVVPPNHGNITTSYCFRVEIYSESRVLTKFLTVLCGKLETLDFKFLLKSKYNTNALCVIEEGPNRQLIGGALQGDARLALFRLSSDEVLEYRVFIKADRVSPFDLAASWRAYQENLRPSAVRGIPDVSLGSVPETGGEVCFRSMHL